LIGQSSVYCFRFEMLCSTKYLAMSIASCPLTQNSVASAKLSSYRWFRRTSMFITWSSAAIIVLTELIVVTSLGNSNEMLNKGGFFVSELLSWLIFCIDGLFSSAMFSSIVGSDLLIFSWCLLFLKIPPSFGLSFCSELFD
jgi:hypothetical protein